jgi:hypothetical protein
VVRQIAGDNALTPSVAAQKMSVFAGCKRGLSRSIERSAAVYSVSHAATSALD